MNYYKDNQGNVYAYDDEQVAMGLAADKTAMTPEEVEAHINPPEIQQTPVIPQEVPANPTVEEWNALCEAAGAPELMK